MIIDDESGTERLGAALATVLHPGDVITLSAPLGAGKTTLIRAVLRALGEWGDIPSPSFAIVQPYETLSPPVWHVDLYRIEDSSELRDLGLDERADERVLFVEWPERAPGRWPDALALAIEQDESSRRRLTAGVPAAWEGRWPPPSFEP